MKKLSSLLMAGVLAFGLVGWGCNSEPDKAKMVPAKASDSKDTPPAKTPDKTTDTTPKADTTVAKTDTPAPTADKPKTEVALNTAAGDTVKIGVLHSLTGTMAISETSLRDAVLMAVEEINAAGGVLGKQIEPVVVDPASDWPTFAEKAKRTDQHGQGGGHVRLLDLGQPQVGAAGLRGIQPIAVLPRPVRRRRAVDERVLHRRGPEPAVDSRPPNT